MKIFCCKASFYFFPFVLASLLIIGCASSSNYLKVEEDRELVEAIKNGERKAVKKLLIAGVDPETKSGDLGETALHIAIKENQTEIAEDLIKHGADIHVRNLYLETPLYRAAAQGNDRVVKLLLESGANHQVFNRWSWSPRKKAEYERHLSTVRLLDNPDSSKINIVQDKRAQRQGDLLEAGREDKKAQGFILIEAIIKSGTKIEANESAPMASARILEWAAEWSMKENQKQQAISYYEAAAVNFEKASSKFEETLTKIVEDLEEGEESDDSYYSEKSADCKDEGSGAGVGVRNFIYIGCMLFGSIGHAFEDSSKDENIKDYQKHYNEKMKSATDAAERCRALAEEIHS